MSKAAAVIPFPNIAFANTAELSLDDYSDLLEVSNEIGHVNLGNVLISKVSHPQMGVITLVSSDNGRYAIIY